MTSKDEEFLKKLRAAFAIEAEEHLQAMSSGLLELEKMPDGAAQMPLIETVFREAHSLKGAARAVNVTEVETLCQALETVFAAWKRGEVKPSSPLFDTLHQAMDAVTKALAAPEGQTVPAVTNTSGLVQQLARMATGDAVTEKKRDGTQGNGVQPKTSTADVPQGAPRPPEPLPPEPPKALEQRVLEAGSTPAPAPEHPTRDNGSLANGSTSEDYQPAQQPAVASDKSIVGETVRISTAKLNALLSQAEEMLAVKLTAGQRAADLREVEAVLGLWQKEWARIATEVRIARQAVEKNQSEEAANSQERSTAPIARLLEFLDWNQSYIKSLETRLAALSQAAEHDRHAMSGVVDNLLEDTKKLLMLPFAILFGGFPRLVRDLARDQGKDVQLVMHGSEVEIDKRILEEMKDPLIHLLRNCVDHGVEEPAERTRHGKTARATVTITVAQVSGNEVEIAISDDGAGINVEKVKSAAVRHGVISAADAESLDEQQALALIFQSEVSTSPIITEISGRGLGMAIVREKTEKLGGRIEVENNPGRGSTFRVLLPLTLATFTGILVEAAGQTLVLPVANVERVHRVKADEIQTVENRETVRLQRASGQEVVSLVRLAEVLEINTAPSAPGAADAGFIYLVVVSAGDKVIAFRVDAILNEQEVLVKKLGKPLVRVRNVAGATVLGSGKVVPILNPTDLIKSAARAGSTPGISSDSGAGEEAASPSILVVEDSITSRMLLKNILEGAGYRVATAVDGVDALTALRAADFDLVVSDVDMPRMNGLDLTAKIRDDKRLAELPVVLVTARGTREDRERGIEVGANAYLVKSSFDQSNLLDAIHRFV